MTVVPESLIEDRLRARGPIRVALVGAGTSGGMITRHLLRAVPHVRLVAVVNRTVGRARAVLSAALGTPPAEVSTDVQLQAGIDRSLPVVCADPALVCASDGIDVIVEATGSVDFGSRVALDAFAHGKHVVLVNAELDATLGPILRTYADASGVVLTHTDGEEPGVATTLVRYLRSIGLRPVAAGNLKGMIDPYRTPDTQREFAAKHHQNPMKVTSFADGTKLAMESTVLANAIGFRVGRRGMYGPRCQHVRDIAYLLPAESMLSTGLVDYALGADPYTGAFVVVHDADAPSREAFQYFKMGDGPFYVFYTPFHLPHLQLVSTIARAVLQHDPTVAPLGPPVCEVAAVAKRALDAGEVLDGVGGFLAYGVIENADTFLAERLLPMGVAEGATVTRPVRKDEPIRYDDVELPPGRLRDRLRAEQVECAGDVRKREASGGAHLA